MKDKDKSGNQACGKNNQPETHSQQRTQNAAVSTCSGKEIAAPEKIPKTSSSWSFCFELLLVIATCTSAGVAIFQWQAMKSQSNIMLRQLGSMSDQTKAAFQQVSTAKISIMIADKTLKDAHESGKEQSARAEKSLDATIKNFRLEQRAWVGPTQISPAEYSDGDKKVYVKEGKPIITGLTIKNTGKTPAKHIFAKAVLQYVKHGDKPIPVEKVIHQIEPSNPILQPGGDMTLPVTLTPGPSNKSELDLVTQKYKVYLTGKITYEDVFREHHWVTFCAFLTPDLLIFVNCPEGNETDD